MSPVVTDVDLHVVIDNNAVGELQITGAAELVEDVTDHVEDDDPHDLALNDDDPATVVCGHTTGMLEYVCTELADKLSILSEDLTLYRQN